MSYFDESFGPLHIPIVGKSLSMPDSLYVNDLSTATVYKLFVHFHLYVLFHFIML